MNVPTGKRLHVLQLLVAKGKMTGGDLLDADSSLPRGTIYTTLLRLEDDKLVSSETKVEHRVAGPPRRYYQITGLGARMVKLAEMNEALQSGATTVPGLGGKRGSQMISAVVALFMLALSPVGGFAQVEASRARATSNDYVTGRLTASGPSPSYVDGMTYGGYQPGTVSGGYQQGDVIDSYDSTFIPPYDSKYSPDTITSYSPDTYAWLSAGYQAFWSRAVSGAVAVLAGFAVWLGWRRGLLRWPSIVWGLMIGGERGFRKFSDAYWDNKDRIARAHTRGDFGMVVSLRFEHCWRVFAMTFSTLANEIERGLKLAKFLGRGGYRW